MSTVRDVYNRNRLVMACDPSLEKQLTDHMNYWSACTACPLHLTAFQKVFYRGQLPCDVMFVGEAPGTVENAMGKPFTGPLAPYIDEIIISILEQVFNKTGDIPRWAITNAVCCFPGSIDKKPTAKEIKTCQPRFVEFLDIAKPKLLVFMGDVAQRLNSLAYIPSEQETRCIPHPGWIARQPTRKKEHPSENLHVKKAALLLGPILTRLMEGTVNAESSSEQQA